MVDAMTRSSRFVGRGVTPGGWLVLGVLALATVGCSSEPIASEQTAQQEGKLLYQLPYSHTGAISIYELEDKSLLMKATGSIDHDDPDEVRKLLALESFPAVYSKINNGAPAPEELVKLDERYRAGLARFVASDQFRSRAAVPASALQDGVGLGQDKSESSFNSKVCNKVFSSGNYKYYPSACNYWFQTFAINTFANPTYRVPSFEGAGPYDWIFGWNDIDSAADLHLLQPVYYGYKKYGSCTIPAYTWAHCSWTSNFSNYEAEITNPNYYSPMGVTIHSIEANVK